VNIDTRPLRQAKHFNYLKGVKGIKNNSELVRLLIAEEYRRIAGAPPLR